jgi:ankyrin repeat protein
MWAGGSQPQQHGGQRNHRTEVHGALLKASGDAPELLQASHEPLHSVALRVDGGVEAVPIVGGVLIGAARNNCANASLGQRPPYTRIGKQLDADSKLAHRRFPELDCGSTGARRLLLQRATLLHVAAEFGNVEAARLLLARGADVNARATVDDAGVGGQTAIFHAVTQFGDRGLPMTQLLVERRADLSVRVKLPGHYERLDEVVECRPLGYALRFQSESHSEGGTVAFLRERGAIE